VWVMAVVPPIERTVSEDETAMSLVPQTSFFLGQAPRASHLEVNWSDLRNPEADGSGLLKVA
jgi:hypothetical protein